MPDGSSVEPSPAATPVFGLTPRRRLAMVLMGYIPLLHAGGVVALLVGPALGLWASWPAALAPVVLYLLPPLVVRLVLLLRPLEFGETGLDSPTFLTWWLTAQWQVLFNRLPLLEELLRLVPGLYSLWLRSWGARVGALVYWSPGCRVLDRPFIDIGHGVVFGAAARLHPHVIAREAHKPTRLILAPIRIGRDAMIGGLSLLTGGARVHDGEQTPAARALPPFSEVRAGRRVRGTGFSF